MSPLRSVGDFIRELFLAVPLEVARLLFVLLPALLLIWVFCLPRTETTAAATSRHSCRNLKIWAILALALQVVIYAFLG